MEQQNGTNQSGKPAFETIASQSVAFGERSLAAVAHKVCKGENVHTPFVSIERRVRGRGETTRLERFVTLPWSSQVLQGVTDLLHNLALDAAADEARAAVEQAEAADAGEGATG